MFADTTGPALATSPLTRSLQALRDDARARPLPGGRAAFVPAAAADAVRMAIVAVLDALVRLLQEFAAGKAGSMYAAVGAVPLLTGSACSGPDMRDGDAADRAGLPGEAMPAASTSQARRASRACAPGLTPSLVPVVAIRSVEPCRILRRRRRHRARRSLVPRSDAAARNARDGGPSYRCDGVCEFGPRPISTTISLLFCNVTDERLGR